MICLEFLFGVDVRGDRGVGVMCLKFGSTAVGWPMGSVGGWGGISFLE